MRTSIRPTVAEIDLGAVQRNLARFRRVVGPSVAVFGVVKADAYGHGAVPVARARVKTWVAGLSPALGLGSDWAARRRYERGCERS